jgi:hypothetical protein
MSKSQIPGSKSQGNLKDQIPKPASSAVFGNVGHGDLDLFGAWVLVIGI